MSEEKKVATREEESENKSDSQTVENLQAVGQIILGEIEKVGGILVADPIAQAEGDYNIEVGRQHKELSDELAETDPDKNNSEKDE